MLLQHHTASLISSTTARIRQGPMIYLTKANRRPEPQKEGGGEIACGNLQSRSKVLGDLERLSSAIAADHHEVLHFLDLHRLFGVGITWIDAHLLASARLSACRLWTLDVRLLKAATKLHLT